MAITFDPLSPASASGSHPLGTTDKSTFKTLTRERQFRHPPVKASDVPALDELVRPHIASFDALVEDNSARGGKGLLQIAAEDIGEKSVFDGRGDEERPWGRKITCESERESLSKEPFGARGLELRAHGSCQTGSTR